MKMFLFLALVSIHARYRGVKKPGRGKASQECRGDKSVERGKAYSSGENSKTRDRRQSPFFQSPFPPFPFPGRSRQKSLPCALVFTRLFNFVIGSILFPYALFFLSLRLEF